MTSQFLSLNPIISLNQFNYPAKIEAQQWFLQLLLDLSIFSALQFKFILCD